MVAHIYISIELKLVSFVNNFERFIVITCNKLRDYLISYKSQGQILFQDNG